MMIQLTVRRAGMKMLNLYQRQRAVWWPGAAQRRFRCPLCRFTGPFVPARAGGRPHAQCPACGSYERHRLQTRALEHLAGWLPQGARCLQFAPDPITPVLRRLCAQVVTADITPGRAMEVLDLTAIAKPDASFDLVYASHVMEHVRDDTVALREIYRVLRPGGLAILPVPLVAERTVEYNAPRPEEHGHVRAPGWDYFERYRAVFPRVTVIASYDIPEHELEQLWVYSGREAAEPSRHADAVPVCLKG